MSSASDRDYGAEIADRLGQQGLAVRLTRFFGGAGLSKDGLQFGFVINGTFYFRVDADGRQEYAARGASPFDYVARGKTVRVAIYYEVPVDIFESDEELAQWASQAIVVATKNKSRGPKKKPV